MKIAPSSAQAQSQPTASDYGTIKKQILALPKKDKQRLMQYITKQLGTV
jgi:hypothetical protein